MKKILFSLLFLAGSFPICAQVQGNIVSNLGDPIPFVNVILLDALDSSLISGGLSVDNGSFNIEDVKVGAYRLHLRLVGYENWYSEPFSITLKEPLKEFGSILMTEETLLMDGVQVTASKMQIEQTPEGTTLNVQSSLMSKGSTALQILERAPGVILDQRNNSLTLNGQSGTLIMINGRPVRLTPSEVINLLEGMSADNLEKVELLTNPSAKYDADGGAGIINLVTRKNEDEGTNSSASVSAGYGWGQKEAASLNINHKTGATSYYGAYSFNYDDFFTTFHGIGKQTIPILGGDVNLDFKNNSARKRTSHNISGGLEKEISDGFLLGGNFLYNNTIIRTDIRNYGSYVFEDDSFLHADINVSGRGVQQNLSTSLFTERQLSNEGKISLDAGYIYYDNIAPTRANNRYEDIEGNLITPENEVYASGNRGESVTSLNIGVLKLDFEQKIGSNIRLETGLKGSYSGTNSKAIIESLQNDQWLTDERSKSKLDVYETIGAAYVSLKMSLDSLTTLTTGLRYENWDRDFSDDVLDNRSGKLFPSAFLSRALSPSSSIQLVYNRRITRPDYNDLTNFLRYNDPTSVFTGTPELQPAISDNLKLSYQLNDITFGLIYTHENNPIARFQIVENGRSDLVIIAPQNIDFLRTTGIQAHVPIPIIRGWDLTTGGLLGYRSFGLSYTRVPANKEYVAYNLYVNQHFTLPRDYMIELSGMYNSDYYNGSVKVNGYGVLNLGLKKDFRNNHGSLQLTISDVLQSMTIRSEYGALTEEAFNSRSSVVFKPESVNARIYRITYSRNFGNSNSKSRKQRQAGSQEEKSRLGQ